jgi:hypothetical protein
MKKNRAKPIAFLIAGLLCGGLAQAQTSTNTSGGDASGSGGTTAYSIGQVFYTADEGATGTVEKGVQHAYEIYTLSTQENLPFSIELSVFPNPTTNQLTLRVERVNDEKLTFQLFDMQGKLLTAEQIQGNETKIDMEHLAQANYLLHVVNQNSENVKTFKIIKN